VHVRIATAADVDAMHRVRTRVRENRLTDPARVQPHHYRALLAGGGRGWVAVEGERVVGFAVVDRARSSVWALFVDPDHERHGIGRALHDAALAWLFAGGAERVWLTTDPGTRAERFYRAAGWQRAGTERNGEIRFETSREDWRPDPLLHLRRA